MTEGHTDGEEAWGWQKGTLIERKREVLVGQKGTLKEKA